MEKAVYFILAFSLCLFSTLTQNEQKLLRSNSFRELHFDKHSNLNDDEIGASLTEEMIDSMLLLARPDYIQVDTGEYVFQSIRDIPVVNSVDVLVIGGTVPAVSAAENGATVFLVAEMENHHTGISIY